VEDELEQPGAEDHEGQAAGVERGAHSRVVGSRERHHGAADDGAGTAYDVTAEDVDVKHSVRAATRTT
jgi:hypothetical protein